MCSGCTKHTGRPKVENLFFNPFLKFADFIDNYYEKRNTLMLKQSEP
jgi:hypothetical protein